MTKTLQCRSWPMGLLVAVLFFMHSSTCAQEIKLNETLYFDKKWKPTSQKKHRYYRNFQLKEDSLVVIEDYYKDGMLQFKGTWVWKDTNDLTIRFLGNLPDHNAIGSATWYDSRGRQTSKVEYLPLNQPCDTTTDYRTYHTDYYSDGYRSITWTEINRKEDGLQTWYDKTTGVPTVTEEMKNGEKHGKRTWFYTDNTIYSIEEYVNGKRHGSTVVYYEYPSWIKEKREYEYGKLISKQKFSATRME